MGDGLLKAALPSSLSVRSDDLFLVTWRLISELSLSAPDGKCPLLVDMFGWDMSKRMRNARRTTWRFAGRGYSEIASEATFPAQTSVFEVLPE